MNRWPAFLFLLVSLAGFTRAHAQDLIVTDKGDSINCRIIRVSDNTVSIRVTVQGRARSETLDKKQIATLSFNYYPGSQANGPGKRADVFFPSKHVRIGLHGGYSYLAAPVSPGAPAFLTNYYEELRSGWHVGFDAACYFGRHLGVGIVYDKFGTANEYENNVVVTYPNGVQRIGRIRDDINTYFIGPAFCMRFYSSNRRFIFTGDLSVGLLTYSNNATLVDPFRIEGNTVALKLGLGTDILLDENFALTIGLSPTLGSLYRVTVDNGTSRETRPLQDPENLTRIDLYAGIRVYVF